MIYQLVYCSKSNHLFTQADLLTLLEEARDFNASKNITGLLLYKDKSFIQIIEGSKTDVIDLYNSIVKDKRHRQVTRLIDKETPQRQFPDWSMGFQNIDQASDRVKGYSSFMSNDALFTKDMAGDVSELLDFFKLNS